MPPMDQGPPLAASPCRHRPRPRRSLGAAVPSAAITAPAYRTTRTPVQPSLPCGRQILLPERQPIFSSELMKMANNVKEEHSVEKYYSPSFSSTSTSPMFERGRLYELYSARRNERLERKQGQMTMTMEDENDVDVGNDPRVAVELSQRRYAKKAASEINVRKSVPANFSLRSSKEMKKKASVTGSCQKPTAAAGNRFTTRSVRRT